MNEAVNSKIQFFHYKYILVSHQVPFRHTNKLFKLITLRTHSHNLYVRIN